MSVITDRVALAVREEIVRQYREDERRKCPAGAAYYEENISPYLIAEAAIYAYEARTDDDTYLKGRAFIANKLDPYRSTKEGS